jgi:hypothetical protein
MAMAPKATAEERRKSRREEEVEGFMKCGVAGIVSDSPIASRLKQEARKPGRLRPRRRSTAQAPVRLNPEAMILSVD